MNHSRVQKRGHFNSLYYSSKQPNSNSMVYSRSQRRMGRLIGLAFILFFSFSIGIVQTSAQTTSIKWTRYSIVESKTAINTVVAADYDGDKKLDVISSYDNKIVLHRGADWRPIEIYRFTPGNSRNKPRPVSIHSCLMDVDGDGDQDFVGSNQTVFWLECPDKPFSGKPWKYRTVDDEILGTHCVVTGDVDGDGQMDLIANSFRDKKDTEFPNSIVWLKVPNDPYNAKQWIRHAFADKDAPGGSHYMGIGDLNKDSRADITCGAKGAPFDGGNWFAWWEQPAKKDAPWKKHVLATNQMGATNINPIDVNGDQHLDIVATRGHGVGVLWFEGPDFKLHEIDEEIAAPHTLVTIDLDGDGDNDIATCGSKNDGKAAWYQNDGKGNFQRFEIDKDQGSYDLRAIDMDGDGDLDLLNAGHGSRNILWYENSLK